MLELKRFTNLVRSCSLCFLAVIANSVHAQNIDKSVAVTNFAFKPDVVYTTGANGPLQGDLYIPDGAGPFPAIVFIHGGGWSSGDRNQLIKLAKELANRGYVGLTIEYDLAPVHYPWSFEESLAAVAYLEDHAAELKIDPTRIAVLGSSAGGELTALVALNPQGDLAVPYKGPRATPRYPVKAAVVLNGALDLRNMDNRPELVKKYLGASCAEMKAACNDASPQLHVHPGAPPFYIGHGTADDTVHYTVATAFVAALEKADDPVHLYTAQDGPHTFWNLKKYYDQNFSEILTFLDSTLKATK